MWLWTAIAAAAIVGLLSWLLLRRRSSSRLSSGDDRLDTVAAWPPSPTRVLTSAERSAYGVLTRAVPGHMVLAQVPLARFLKVPTRHSYSEWLRRLGTQCCDFVVCDMASEVIAVVSVQAPAEQESERGRKRHLRMARVLKAAGIPLHVWTRDALPSPEAARELILPRPAAAAAPAAAPATAAAVPVIGTEVRPSRPSPLDEEGRDSSQDERIEMREPTPSTWFDEFNSGPTPLPGDRQRREG